MGEGLAGSGKTENLTGGSPVTRITETTENMEAAVMNYESSGSSAIIVMERAIINVLEQT